MDDPLRVYFAAHELGNDGYPHAWHNAGRIDGDHGLRWFERPTKWQEFERLPIAHAPIKDMIRERDGHRCLRCGHPYTGGQHGGGQWSACDERCTHPGPMRVLTTDGEWTPFTPAAGATASAVEALGMFPGVKVEAQWRILTVHHLNGIKHDCRWWNLVSLCQRDHLSVQSRVQMERVYPFEHSDWFKPFAAGYYASVYLGEELTRDEVMGRLDELLALERQA